MFILPLVSLSSIPENAVFSASDFGFTIVTYEL